MTLIITYKSGKKRTITNCRSADIDPNDNLYYGIYPTEHSDIFWYNDDVDLSKVEKMEIIFNENT